MKVYVCPICDHVMAGKYYCHICHQFVSSPYYIEKNYSLDRDAAEPEIRMEPETKTKPETKIEPETRTKLETRTELEADSQKKTARLKRPKMHKRTDRKVNSQKTVQRTAQKTAGGKHLHIIWLFIIYILFRVGIVSYPNLPKVVIERIENGIGGLSSKKAEPEKLEGSIEEEILSDWSYETPDYEEILEKGEESTGLTHFSVDGEEFIDKIHRVLNDADFDVIESGEYMENYIAFNLEQGEKYSYFENIQTFYLTEDSTEYYRISKDSVSGRLIDTEIESRDFDQACFFVRAAASILFPDNKRKQKRVEKLNNYLEKLLGEETYFSERIGTIIISGYTYTRDSDKNTMDMAFHISLSKAEDA